MKKDKNNDTALRILEVLKILLRNDVTKHQLIDKLKTNSTVECVYTQEAFIKYFNTLEAVGLKIDKEGRVYKLNNALTGVELTLEEENLLLKIIQNTDKLYNKDLEDCIYSLFKKTEKYVNVKLSEKIRNIISENKKIKNENIKNNVITTIVNYIADKQLVSLTYKKNNSSDEETIITEIKNIIKKNNKMYITCYNSLWMKNRRILIDSIVELKQLAQKTPETLMYNPVIYKLSGRLAKSYRLKPSENVIDFSHGELTVSNTDEDKDTLVLRLLKYGENCKILKPVSMQKELLRLTESIMKNLE